MKHKTLFVSVIILIIFVFMSPMSPVFANASFNFNYQSTQQPLSYPPSFTQFLENFKTSLSSLNKIFPPDLLGGNISGQITKSGLDSGSKENQIAIGSANIGWNTISEFFSGINSSINKKINFASDNVYSGYAKAQKFFSNPAVSNVVAPQVAKILNDNYTTPTPSVSVSPSVSPTAAPIIFSTLVQTPAAVSGDSSSNANISISGNDIGSSALVAAHKVFKPRGSKDIYFFQNNFLHLVPDSATLKSLGFSDSDVFQVSPETFAFFQIGDPIETVINPFSNQQTAKIQSLIKKEIAGANLTQLTDKITNLQTLINQNVPLRSATTFTGSINTAPTLGNSSTVITGTSLSISGAGTFGSLSVSGAGTFGSLSVGTFSATTAASHSFAGDLSISGKHLAINGVTYSFPSADGSNGQFLTTNGAKTLTWATSSGGLTVQTGIAANQLTFFQSSTVASGSAKLNWDSTNKRLGIGKTNSPLTTLEIGGTASISGLTNLFGGASISLGFSPTSNNAVNLGNPINSFKTGFFGTSLLIGKTGTSPLTALEVKGAASIGGNTIIKGPSPWVDVKVYGAKGDGATSDAIALTNALSAASSTGGTVFLGPSSGAYVIDSTITLSQNNINIQCAPNVMIKFTSSGVDGIDITGNNNQITNCKFDGSGTITKPLISINASGSFVSFNTFQNVGTVGTGVISIIGGKNTRISNNTFTSSTKTSINIDATSAAISRVWVDKNFIKNVNASSIGVVMNLSNIGVDAISITNNKILSEDICIYAANAATNSIMQGNDCERTAGTNAVNGYSVFGWVSGSITGNTCRDNGFTIGFSSAACFSLHDMVNVAVTGNEAYMTGNGGLGFFLLDSQRVTLTGNTVSGNISAGIIQNGFGAANSGILFQTSATYTNLNNNIIADNIVITPPSFTGSAIQIACTTVGSDCSDNTINGNHVLSDNTAGSVGIALTFSNGTFNSTLIQNNSLTKVKTGISVASSITNTQIGMQQYDTVATQISDSGANTSFLVFNPGNKFGIGTNNPKSKFVIVDSAVGGAGSASFSVNSSLFTGSIASISAISLTTGSVFSITVPASTSVNIPHGLMLVKDTSGNVIASWSNGGRLSTRALYSHTSNVTCAAGSSGGCIDYAESYPTVDTTITPGDLVSIDVSNPPNVIKSNNPDTIIGIVSTNPAIVIGNSVSIGAQDQEPGFVPVALAGRVPLKVSLENGPIKVGDKLTASSVPGIAMKATQAGRVVGISLASLSSIASGSYDRVLTFVNPQWFGGDFQMSQTASVSDGGIATLPSGAMFDINILFANIVKSFEKVLNIVFKDGLIKVANIITDSLTAKNISTDKLCVGDTCVNRDQLKALIDKLGTTDLNSTINLSPTPLPVATPTPIISSTPTPISITASASLTLSPSTTPVPTISPTPVPSKAPTVTPNPSPTIESTTSPSAQPTVSPPPSTTPTPEPSLSPGPSETPIPTISPSKTPIPSETPTPTPTASMEAVPSPEPSPSLTPSNTGK